MPPRPVAAFAFVRDRLEGSPDLAAAVIAAEALGTVHHGSNTASRKGWTPCRK